MATSAENDFTQPYTRCLLEGDIVVRDPIDEVGAPLLGL